MDIIARNGREVVATEVKSNLEVRDADPLLKDIMQCIKYDALSSHYASFVKK